MSTPDLTPFVVGLDLSLTGSGLADSTGRCGSVGEKGVTKLPLEQRWTAIRRIAEGVWTWIQAGARLPDLVVVEGIQATSRDSGAATEERIVLWWWVVGALLDAQVPVAVAHVSVLKRYATGRAATSGPKMVTKAELVEVVTTWGRWKIGRDNNKADAAILVALGSHKLGHRLVEVTPKQESALQGLDIPSRGGENANSD